MAKLIEMDKHVTLASQMEEEDIGGQIILSRFTVNPGDVDGFLKVSDDATLMKQQPGLDSIAQRYWW